jgi:predicted DNA-binding protein
MFGRHGMTTQMIIRIDNEVKNRLAKLARLEGKSTSELVRELIEERIKERDIGAYVDDLWDRIGGKLTSRGVMPELIEKTIRASRTHK